MALEGFLLSSFSIDGPQFALRVWGLGLRLWNVRSGVWGWI